MRFWDSSAILPLLVREKGSEMVRGWLEQDPEIAVWGLTRVEVISAVERRTREARIGRADRRRVLARFERLSGSWHEITDLVAVRTNAATILSRQPLRAADACQVGAASLLAEGDPSQVEFACLDRRLAEAADREGFRVLSWPS